MNDLKELLEYERATEEQRLGYAEYLDKWFTENKFVDVENNPLPFYKWRRQLKDL